MVTNPIQKQKRNSLLGGLAIGIIIGLVLCVVLYMFLTSKAGSVATSKEGTIKVIVLNKEIKSGSTVTAADYSVQTVNKSIAPTDAIGAINGTAVAKIDLSAGTVLSNSMLTQENERLTKDLREQQYNMITLPTDLVAGDFIDIRLQLSDGGDYIVASKKSVQKATDTTVWLKMNEEEILAMSNAIVEYYTMAGSKLYATKYTDPGSQEAAVTTYSPNDTVRALMLNDDNITSQLQDGTGRLSEKFKAIRKAKIDAELGKYSETGLENLEKNIKEEIESLKESRQAYFGTLNSAN